MSHRLLPSQYQQRVGLGVYIHVPFCATRCDYCAFSTWTDKANLIDDYVDACLIAIEGARRSGELTVAQTVFIGGGTPSLIGPRHLSRLVRSLEVEKGAEITVECNPESTDQALLRGLMDAGVTRISLGVQSVHSHVLSGLGRFGDPETSFAAMAAIGEAGFSTFNVDVIYGGFGESDDDFASNLSALLACTPSPPHVSAYALTIERGTPLALDRSRHPDDDLLADRYGICDEILAAAGLSWYEVSNWAVAGHECRHNVNCWQEGNYVGIGCAAHGHDNGRRYHNLATPEQYIAAIRANQPTVAGEERLPRRARLLESLELALRTRWGVPERYLTDDPDLSDLIGRRGGYRVLTRRGRLLLNEVAARLVIDVDPLTLPDVEKEPTSITLRGN